MPKGNSKSQSSPVATLGAMASILGPAYSEKRSPGFTWRNHTKVELHGKKKGQRARKY